MYRDYSLSHTLQKQRWPSTGSFVISPHVRKFKVKEVLTMQFLGRSSLRVRKLPGVNSSLLAKFMEEEGGVGIRKESQKICHCGRFLFPVNQ